MALHQYAVGDAVWVKVPSFPWWPGIITEPDEDFKKSYFRSGRAPLWCVNFIPHEVYEPVWSPKNIKPFDMDKDKLIKDGRGRAKKNVELRLEFDNSLEKVMKHCSAQSQPAITNSEDDLYKDLDLLARLSPEWEPPTKRQRRSEPCGVASNAHKSDNCSTSRLYHPTNSIHDSSQPDAKTTTPSRTYKRRTRSVSPSRGPCLQAPGGSSPNDPAGHADKNTGEKVASGCKEIKSGLVVEESGINSQITNRLCQTSSAIRTTKNSDSMPLESIPVNQSSHSHKQSEEREASTSYVLAPEDELPTIEFKKRSKVLAKKQTKRGRRRKSNPRSASKTGRNCDVPREDVLECEKDIESKIVKSICKSMCDGPSFDPDFSLPSSSAHSPPNPCHVNSQVDTDSAVTAAGCEKDIEREIVKSICEPMCDVPNFDPDFSLPSSSAHLPQVETDSAAVTAADTQVPDSHSEMCEPSLGPDAVGKSSVEHEQLEMPRLVPALSDPPSPVNETPPVLRRENCGIAVSDVNHDKEDGADLDVKPSASETGPSLQGSGKSSDSEDDDDLPDVFGRWKEAHKVVIERGELVWVKQASHPFWPALVKNVYKKGKQIKRLTVVFIYGNPPKTAEEVKRNIFSLSYNKKAVIPYAQNGRQDHALKDEGSQSPYGVQFTESYRRCDEFIHKRCLKAVNSSLEFFAADLGEGTLLQNWEFNPVLENDVSLVYNLRIEGMPDEITVPEDKWAQENVERLLRAYSGHVMSIEKEEPDNLLYDDTMLDSDEEDEDEDEDEEEDDTQEPIISMPRKLEPEPSVNVIRRRLKRKENNKKLVSFIKSDKCKKHLEKVYHGSVKNAFRDEFNKSDRRDIVSHTGPFEEDEQLDEIMAELCEHYQEIQGNSGVPDLNYIYSVWLQEAIVYALINVKGYGRKRAVELLHRGVKYSREEVELRHAHIITRSHEMPRSRLPASCPSHL